MFMVVVNPAERKERPHNGDQKQCIPRPCSFPAQSVVIRSLDSMNVYPLPLNRSLESRALHLAIPVPSTVSGR